MKDNAYLLSSPWIGVAKILYFSSGAFKTCIASYNNNYLKMHGKVPHDDGIDSLAMMAEYVQNPLGGKATAMQNPFWGRR